MTSTPPGVHVDQHHMWHLRPVVYPKRFVHPAGSFQSPWDRSDFSNRLPGRDGMKIPMGWDGMG